MKAIFVILASISFPSSSITSNPENNACLDLDSYINAETSEKCYVNPDVLSDAEDIARRRGYDIEKFTLLTDDGYKLGVFHISPKSSNTQKYSVFIQHGILVNCAVWIDIGNRSLAFFLADQGYHVWLGNIRGTTYSREHTTLSINDSKYWDFNLDKLAKNDMYTQLKFVAETSNQKVHYIGHSMGTTLGLMFMTTFTKETNQWLQSATLLAPVIYLFSVPGIELVKIPGKQIIDLLKLTGIHGLFYQETEIHKILTDTVKHFPHLGTGLINTLFGPTENFPSEDLLVYYSNWPTGTSVFQLEQYLQFAFIKRFQKYNHGLLGNLKEYRSILPPRYKLSNVKIPVGLFYGEKDIFYHKPNFKRLYKELGSEKKYMYSIPIDESKPRYDHVDFMYGENITVDLYGIMMHTIKASEGNQK